MKNILPLLIAFLSTQFALAQYCGNFAQPQPPYGNPSGPSQCSIVNLSSPGFGPVSDSLAPFVNGTQANTTIQFRNFDTVRAAGQLVTIQQLRIDSIGNLPAGTCWATSDADNTLSNQQSACIKISGLVCATPGQYRLRIFVTPYIGSTYPGLALLGSVDASALGINYYLRVNNSGGATVAIDTTGQSAGTNYFKTYGISANCASPLTVNLGANQNVCANASVTLQAVISGGQSPFTYSWSSNTNNLSCNSCTSPTAIISQSSTITVTVTDNNGSSATDNITYTISAGSVQISAGGPTTFCQGGSVTLNAGANFTAYSWSNSSSTSQITVTQGGTYAVTVTNSSGCTFTDSEVVTVTTPSISNYQITASGPTSFCTGGSVTLNAGSGFTGYEWSNSSSSSSITVSQSGTYSVSVTGTDGCSYADTQVVNTATGFSGQQICIVSLNPATSKNVVVWQKTNGAGVDSFRIYKEIAGQFQLIRQQPFTDFSTYEDAQSNAANQSEKYAISTMDACGESAKSAAHQTMYLTYGLNGNNQMELNWTPYVGVTGSIVTVYRGSSPTNLSQLTQLGPGTLSYVDLTPPSPPVYYQVEVTNPLGCVPSKTDGYSSSLSNILEVLSTDITAPDYDNLTLYSFYDQNTGETVLRWAPTTMRIQNVTVYDLSGRKVYANNSVQGPQVTLSHEIATGAYVAEVSDGNKVVRKKIFVR